MVRHQPCLARAFRFLLCISCGLILAAASFVRAEVVTLKNGMQFEGRVGKIASLGENPLNPAGAAGQVKVQQIVLIDDDLRRIFVSSLQVQSVVPRQTPLERIRIDQRTASGSRRIAAVGPILRVTPFDEFGRRIFSMNTAQGPVHVVQGITEVTPTYTRVEGLQARSAYVWDMRVATSSIPRDTLSKILMQQIDPKNSDERLRLVRLYIQAERYPDAKTELEGVIKDFPALADLQTQVVSLHQMSARRLIKEIELRRSAGQHQLAYTMLDRFPPDGVAGEILLQVRDMLDDYKAMKKRAEEAAAALQGHTAAIANAATRAEAEPIVEEILRELNLSTFDRMADYLRLAGDPKLTPEQKVSLAVSGWLLGSGAGTENLAVGVSLYQVRALVRQYLNASLVHERQEILAKLQSLEGSSPSYVARLLAHMKPPVETESVESEPPGHFTLTVPGLQGQGDVQYSVQLPPEYDPYRRYPCVVTLNGAGTTPEQQIDWWAGDYHAESRLRLGQATRQGYIVIAPVWSRPHQREYEFSAQEHAAVLYSLRDACRRFSIDTDRVYLSGHSMGGDAAWDMGLSHPDLWAGVIPVVATADKYISRYWENGRHVAFYFVAGEMDGDRMGKNGMDWDRYMTRPFYDTTIVVYQGRGHEHFHDEVQRIFDWMSLHRRDFHIKSFECVSMRPWDNFFWWSEIDNLPSASVTLPVNWPPTGSVRPARTEGRILENNRLILRTGASVATVWLSPQTVDLNSRVSISLNGRDVREAPEASVQVLLEDVRTRGDRQHPFWAKIESSRGR
ncbi:MAG: peptidase [Pirellulaceae bacterium]|nr:peptidase [Pirellulaceae bacterium]